MDTVIVISYSTDTVLIDMDTVIVGSFHLFFTSYSLYMCPSLSLAIQVECDMWSLLYDPGGSGPPSAVPYGSDPPALPPVPLQTALRLQLCPRGAHCGPLPGDYGEGPWLQEVPLPDLWEGLCLHLHLQRPHEDPHR